MISTFRALAERWMPAGDQGIIATRAYDVFSSHPPLVGQYSLVSTVTGHQILHSPGPMLYWLIALPARLGSPHTIALAIGLTNALAIVAIVALVRARAGIGAAISVAIALALVCRSFMPEALHDNWNPSAGLLPFALLVFTCWSLACGDRRLLPAVALLASFTAQCQVAFLAPTVGLVLAGVGGLALCDRPWWSRPASPGEAGANRRCPGAPTHGRLWPWALAAALVLAVCWTPPLLDQLEHRPGNLSLLYRAATRHRHTVGATAGMRALVRSVGLPPRWLRLPSDPFDSRLADVTGAPGALASASALLALLALSTVGVLGAWRRRPQLAWAALIGLLLCGALAAVAASTPLSSEKVLGYTLWWGSIAGMWVWLTLAGSLAVLLRGRLPGRALGCVFGWLSGGVGGCVPGHLPGGVRVPAARAPTRLVRVGRLLGPVLGLAAVTAVGLAVGLSQARDAHSSEYGPIDSLSRQLARAPLPAGATIWLRSTLGGAASPLSQAVKFLLRRQGLRVLQRGASARLGPWYELDHRPYRYVVYAYDRPRAPDTKARVLARVEMDESRPPFPGAPTAHRLRTLTVSVAGAPRASP